MNPSKHDFTATEIKAGALVLAAIVILVVFLGAVRGCHTRGGTMSRYFAIFTDISGLNSGADVRFGGVKVGRVVAIETDSEDRSRIRVTASVRGEVPVNRGSVASIQQVTLTTAKHLEISTGGSDMPLHSSGDMLVSRGGGGFMDMPDLEGFVHRLEVVLDGVVALLGVDRAAQRSAEGGPEPVDMTQLLTSLDETVNESSTTMRELGGVIKENRAGFQEVVNRLVELEVATTELMAQFNAVVSENRQPLNETVLNLERLTGETNRHLEELAGSLRLTLQHLQDVGGNASDLLDDQRPTLEDILINLQDTTRNLSEFSRTLAEQPQALIRGRKTQGRKPEESQ